jgi:predicted phage-related endonuclease
MKWWSACTVALTPEQRIAREGKLTASAIGALVSGDKQRILNLWREMIGDPAYVEEDLSGVWPVQLGSTTEQLNLDWYERKMGYAITRRGEVVNHPDLNWAAATLDGFDPVYNFPIETKHVGGWEKTEAIIQRYMPQMHWQMECTGTKLCAISIIQGAAEPYVERIHYDKDYADQLMARALKFMEHVWNMTEPVVIESVAPKYMPHDQLREINMIGDNKFASLASQWIANKKQAKEFEDASKELKENLPYDAKRAFGYGIQVKRAKNGSLRITPMD